MSCIITIITCKLKNYLFNRLFSCAHGLSFFHYRCCSGVLWKSTKPAYYLVPKVTEKVSNEKKRMVKRKILDKKKIYPQKETEEKNNKRN